jgi:hypothetical protein
VREFFMVTKLFWWGRAPPYNLYHFVGPCLTKTHWKHLWISLVNKRSVKTQGHSFNGNKLGHKIAYFFDLSHKGALSELET